MASQPPRKRPVRRRRPAALDRIPDWVQALVAVLTLVFTVLTAYGLAGRRDDNTAVATPSLAASAVAPQADVRIVRLHVVSDAVEGLGTFSNLNLGADAIFLIGQPQDDPDALWVPVRAETVAEATLPIGLANGTWRATRPVPATKYDWQAVVWPASLGAGDDLADLREHGPDAGAVRAASEVFQLDE